LALEQAGVLSLDDPVCRTVPELNPEPAWLKEEISFRDLLSNRLGVARGGLSDYGLANCYDYAELARRMSHMPRVGPFRSTYSYCNPAFCVAVLAYTRLTGLSFAELLQQYLFGPAGLTQTAIGPTARASTDRASAHTVDRREELVIVDEDDDWARPGGGGIMSTAADQQRWLRLNLGRGQLDGKQILPATLWDELWQPHVFLKPSDRFMWLGDPEAPFAAYGLGWFLSTYHGRFMAAHSGGGVGWRAYSAMLPDQGIGVSILINVDGKTGTAVLHRLLERCLGIAPRPWLDIVRNDRTTKYEKSIAHLDETFPRSPDPALDPTSVSGRYWNAQSGTVEVTANEGRVSIQFEDGATYDGELQPLGGAIYAHEPDGPFATYDGPNAPAQRVRFEESEGRINRLIHSYIGSFERC
jgi:CubicO group peptidase (beta-lactamase class C family)